MNHKKTLDIAIWGLIALFVAGWIVLALQNLGFLSLWMDEGFHYLAAEGILKHGYPLFPSGHIYYKAILYTYILAFFSLVFGLKAATLRLISVLAIGVLIPSAYLVAKKFFSRTIGILTVGILTLSVWEAEYARLALYFAPLQLFYLLSLYFFYQGFVEDRKNFKILATIFFILIPLVHQLGMGVWFCFPALLFMKGLKRFFKKDVLASFSITTLFYVFVQIYEFFFWKVGYVYAKEDTSFRGMINYFVSGFSLDYFKEFFRSFPRMSLVVLAGLFLYLGSRFGKNGEPDAQTGTPDRTPWFYLNLCLFFPMLFLGFFRTHVQPRYLAQLFPVFVILFLAGLYRLSEILLKVFVAPVFRLEKKKTALAAALVLFLGLVVLLTEGTGLAQVLSIVNRRYGDPIEADIITRSGRFEQYDNQGPGEYVRHFLRDDDIVIAIHVVFQKIYTGRVDYWLWSGGPGTWDAWEKTPDGWKDFYVGARWINNLADLQKVIEENPGRRVWLIANPSLLRRDHIKQEIANYIKGNTDKLVFRGKDGMSEVYLWHEQGLGLTGESHTYEGEWLPSRWGKVVFEQGVSKNAALSYEGGRVRPDDFDVRLDRIWPAGSYQCRVRLMADPKTAREKILSMVLIQNKEKLRSFTVTRNGLSGRPEYQDFTFPFYLKSESRLFLKFSVPGGQKLRIDFVDILPKGATR